MGKTYTLLVWEELPESVRLVLIDNAELDSGDHATFAKAHGLLQNCDELTTEQETAVDCLNNALCDNPKYLGDAHPVGSKWAMRFAKCAVDRGEERIDFNGKVITHVYRTGWVL